MAKTHRKSHRKSHRKAHRKSHRKSHRKTHRKMRGGRNVFNRVVAIPQHAIGLASNVVGAVGKTGKSLFGTAVNAATGATRSVAKGASNILRTTAYHSKGAVRNTFMRKSRKDRKSRKMNRKH